MKLRTTLILIVLTAAAWAYQRAYTLNFSGSTTTAITANDTLWTNWQRCDDGRAQALYWKQWVNVGAADSGQVKVIHERAMTNDSTDYLATITTADTVTTLAISVPADTAGAERGLDYQFYPKPCWYIRFGYIGLTGCSDSTNVGYAVLRLDNLQ